MTALMRNILAMALAAILALVLSATAADEATRLFAFHSLALRAAGVAGEKQAGEVVSAMPGAASTTAVRLDAFRKAHPRRHGTGAATRPCSPRPRRT